MADDAQSIRSINWRELFPFTNLFRAFRIAIHPSKLVLGFAMVLLLYAGGRIMDLVWPISQFAAYQEIDGYEAYHWAPPQSPMRLVPFEDRREQERTAAGDAYFQKLLAAKIVKDEEAAHKAAEAGDYRGKLQASYVTDRDKAIEAAAKSRDDALKGVKDAKMTDKERADKERDIRHSYEKAVQDAETALTNQVAQIETVTPHGIFDSLFNYEVQQFHHVVDSALNWNWLGGISHGTVAPGHEEAEGGPAHVAPAGVVRSLINLTVVGPGWLLRYHFIYFIIFAVWKLLLWAVFGGAIARIAGVHIARDEKISVRQALRFSSSKLLSFVFAPIIPLIIILVAGVVVGAGGLLLYIPWVGPIVVGALFILALLAGFVMTLVATGTIGGFNLMYPTIAVEGSDSFDAISRSFSYIFARPWRMLFYSAVSLVYGGLCFLFVRYFVYVMLALTHFFVQWFLFGSTGRHWPEIWPAVSDQDLTYKINFQALSVGEGIGAFLIALWIYIVLGILAAFVISFYFSANTIIYYLMRREVDATELDDVYVEESEDDFTEAAAAPATPAAPAASAPAAAPAAPPPTDTPPAPSAPPA